MFSIITIDERNEAHLHRSGIKTEQAAKMLRGKLVKKYDMEKFIVNEDSTAELRVNELNNGDIKVSEDGESFEIVKKVVPVAKTVVPKRQVPSNILHMISVTTGTAHQQWVNIATRNYGYKAGV